MASSLTSTLGRLVVIAVFLIAAEKVVDGQVDVQVGTLKLSDD